MSNIKKPTRNVSGVGAITPLYQSDIDRKIDEKIALQNRLLSLIGVKDGDPRYADVLIIADYVLALINEARVDEIVRVLQQPYISAHLYGQARIAQLKPDTTLEGGKR